MLNKKNSRKNELLKYVSIAPMAVMLLLTSHLSVASNTVSESEILSALDVNTKEKTEKTVSVLEWVKSDINLGEVAKNVPATATYEFVNHGDKPVMITNVKTSCGCTSKSYTKEPVQPGEKGTVKATYNAKKVGAFSKTITVSVNDGSTPKHLRIRGIVITKN